jgi:mono/diheme cytochrome c family protein
VSAKSVIVSAQRRVALSAAKGLVLVVLSGCSWFTDFKEQPKIDPWDTPNDSTPPRGNPQGSVPVYGTAAPEFAYARTSMALESMTGLQNPTAVDQRSLDRGRKSYQINCAVCHGALGQANGPVVKYGLFPASLGPTSPSAARSDGYLFAVIRNGKNTMPSYNRIDEDERWDLVNYIRSLQGKTGAAADSSHGLPGETGDKLPGATKSAPTRPAPYYNQLGAQAGAREGLMGTVTPVVKPPADSGRPPAVGPVPAHRPPTPEVES